MPTRRRKAQGDAPAQQSAAAPPDGGASDLDGHHEEVAGGAVRIGPSVHSSACPSLDGSDCDGIRPLRLRDAQRELRLVAREVDNLVRCEALRRGPAADLLSLLQRVESIQVAGDTGAGVAELAETQRKLQLILGLLVDRMSLQHPPRDCVAVATPEPGRNAGWDGVARLGHAGDGAPQDPLPSVADAGARWVPAAGSLSLGFADAAARAAAAAGSRIRIAAARKRQPEAAEQLQQQLQLAQCRPIQTFRDLWEVLSLTAFGTHRGLMQGPTDMWDNAVVMDAGELICPWGGSGGLQATGGGASGPAAARPPATTLIIPASAVPAGGKARQRRQQRQQKQQQQQQRAAESGAEAAEAPAAARAPAACDRSAPQAAQQPAPAAAVAPAASSPVAAAPQPPAPAVPPSAAAAGRRRPQGQDYAAQRQGGGENGGSSPSGAQHPDYAQQTGNRGKSPMRGRPETAEPQEQAQEVVRLEAGQCPEADSAPAPAAGASPHAVDPPPAKEDATEKRGMLRVPLQFPAKSSAPRPNGASEPPVQQISDADTATLAREVWEWAQRTASTVSPAESAGELSIAEVCDPSSVSALHAIIRNSSGPNSPTATEAFKYLLQQFAASEKSQDSPVLQQLRRQHAAAQSAPQRGATGGGESQSINVGRAHPVSTATPAACSTAARPAAQFRARSPPGEDVHVAAPAAPAVGGGQLPLRSALSARRPQTAGPATQTFGFPLRRRQTGSPAAPQRGGPFVQRSTTTAATPAACNIGSDEQLLGRMTPVEITGYLVMFLVFITPFYIFWCWAMGVGRSPLSQRGQ